jgi:hypothetical protein
MSKITVDLRIISNLYRNTLYLTQSFPGNLHFTQEF